MKQLLDYIHTCTYSITFNICLCVYGFRPRVDDINDHRQRIFLKLLDKFVNTDVTISDAGLKENHVAFMARVTDALSIRTLASPSDRYFGIYESFRCSRELKSCTPENLRYKGECGTNAWM